MEDKVSIFLTAYKEDKYLPRILADISRQDYKDFEILLLESGENQKNTAAGILGKKSENLRYFHKPGLPRTHALNFLVKESTGHLLVRLDARSHIDPDYISRIVQLSQKTGATNVGGVMWPMGETRIQRIIACLMQSPVVFGGAKFRKSGFSGEAETVYLGAFRKKDIPFKEWFDGKHPEISEDSDLNYRLRSIGKKIFIDSAIRANHFPRESLPSLFRLCFNYGVGRGIFVIKHRAVLAFRQTIMLLSVSLLILLSIIAFKKSTAAYSIIGLLMVYIASIFLEAMRQKFSKKDKIIFILGAFGCHLFWTMGLLASPFQFGKDLFAYKKHKSTI